MPKATFVWLLRTNLLKIFMAARQFIRHISAQSVQFLLNQCFGLIIFVVLSASLNPVLFGEINWALAVLLTTFGILHFGIDQLIVRKFAAGEAGGEKAFGAYLLHVLVTGSVFYVILAICYFAMNGVSVLQVLLLLGAGKLFIFFSNPFRQLAVGKEKFRELMYMSIVSNVIRGSGLLLLWYFNHMEAASVIGILVAGDVLECLVCIWIGRKYLKAKLTLNKNIPYQFSLIREALPQAGSFVFSAIQSRFDWILIGLMISSTELAAYSFAWKSYEIATLPLLIIAPVMIPLFTRNLTVNHTRPATFSFLAEWQVAVACFVALLINICWVPLADGITGGKYGAVNRDTMFILTLSMPLAYINNYYWTIHFAYGNLKKIFTFMGLALLVNIFGCLALIPLFESEGAALANFLSALTLVCCYGCSTKAAFPPKTLVKMGSWIVITCGTGFLLYQQKCGIYSSILLTFAVFSVASLINLKNERLNWAKLHSLYATP